mgnify:CR=1 FL=1
MRAAEDDRADEVAAGRRDRREDRDAEDHASGATPRSRSDVTMLDPRQADQDDRELHDQPEREEQRRDEVEVRAGRGEVRDERVVGEAVGGTAIANGRTK